MKIIYTMLFLIISQISVMAAPNSAYQIGVDALINANYKNAIQNFQTSIEEGYADAYFSLAHMYYYGLGVKMDEQKAFDLAKKGYEAGSIPSATLYARFLWLGIDGRKKDEELAKSIFDYNHLTWLEEHYESDDNPLYASFLGLLYGGSYFDLEKDIDKLQYWYQKAIDQNFALGYTGIAYLYGFSNDVDPNKELAINYYQKASDLELPLAYRNLAIMLRDGDGIEKDLQRAIILFKKAVADGDTECNIDLATIYDYRLGEKVDWQKAFAYYKKAESLEVPWALRELGEFYYFGIGGAEKNYSKALNLFTKAADGGDETAKQYLQVIDDIASLKYYNLNKTNHGNSIYITNEEMAEQKEHLPYICTDQTLNWYTKVNYSLGEADFVQIWPTTKIENITDKNDYFWFKTYSGSKGFTAKKGSHEAGIGIADDANGYRDLAYIYFNAVFSKKADERNTYVQETLYIKQPVAICVLPANYPGVQENIESKKVDLNKEIIGKWKLVDSFMQCSDSSENKALDADECTAKTTYEFFENGVLKASVYNWEETNPFAEDGDYECNNTISDSYNWKIEADALIISREGAPDEEFTRLEIKGDLLTIGAPNEGCESGGIFGMDFRKVTK